MLERLAVYLCLYLGCCFAFLPTKKSKKRSENDEERAVDTGLGSFVKSMPTWTVDIRLGDQSEQC